jgi:hypothetical protein
MVAGDRGTTAALSFYSMTEIVFVYPSFDAKVFVLCPNGLFLHTY